MTRRDFICAATTVAVDPTGIASKLRQAAKRSRLAPHPILRSPKASETTVPMARTIITVSTPPPPPPAVSMEAGVVAHLAKDGTLTWSGGTGPFQLQENATLDGQWFNVGPVTMVRSTHVPLTGPSMYFRVQEQVPLLFGTFDSGTCYLTWSAPQLVMPDSVDHYALERSTDGGTNYSPVKTIAGNLTATTDNFTPNPQVKYRLTGTSVGGSTIPYNILTLTAGQTSWLASIKSVLAAYIQTAKKVVFTPEGGVIVVGEVQNQFQFSTIIETAYAYPCGYVAKYNVSGALVWHHFYSTSSTSQSSVTGACVDATGNIYICGSFTGVINFGGTDLSSASRDAFVVKLDSDGNFLYQAQIGSTVALNDFANSIACSSDGSVVYVLGNFVGTTANPCSFGNSVTLKSEPFGGVFIAKYSSNLTCAWAVGIGNNDPNGTAARAISCDSGGTYAIAGGSFYSTCHFGGVYNGSSWSGGTTKTSNGQDDAYVVKYLADGTFSFVTAFGSTGSDIVEDLCIAPNGEIYAVGEYHESLTLDSISLLPLTSGYDVGYLLKLSPTGVGVWGRQFGGISANQSTLGVACDATGVIVVGQQNSLIMFNGSGGSAYDGSWTYPLKGGGDVYIAAYSSSNVFSWVTQAGDLQEDRARSVAISGARIAVCGYFHSSIAFGALSAGTIQSGQDAFVVNLNKSTGQT